MTYLLDLLGIALVTVGVGLVCLPAAFVVLGAFLLWTSWNLSRQGVTDEPPVPTRDRG